MHRDAAAAIADLSRHADPQRAAGNTRYFKTGVGEYGEGDVFLGTTLGQVRAVSKAHGVLPLDALADLMGSELHEVRLLGVLGYVLAYRAAGDDAQRQAVHDAYLAQSERINNWDLVDASAEHVVGPYLDIGGTAVLDRLAASPLVWDRRIAMLATFHRIKRGEADDALRIAERLLADRHPLIEKAVGWMLREVGKRVGEAVLTGFIDAHVATMSATTLSYATERLTPEQRAAYRALRPRRRAQRPAG